MIFTILRIKKYYIDSRLRACLLQQNYRSGSVEKSPDTILDTSVVVQKPTKFSKSYEHPGAPPHRLQLKYRDEMSPLYMDCCSMEFT